MKNKILYGICGIGSGHSQRQLPIILELAKDSEIVIFAYDFSFEFYTKYFDKNENIVVVEVAVPFYVSNGNGIDFTATEKLERNKKDYKSINELAFERVSKTIGTPDLVISDYEPICAQYAYKNNIQLITIDQQSKYLSGIFEESINGINFKDEVDRLRMFFPKATARIVCSFFNFDVNKNAEELLIFAPIIKNEIRGISNNVIDNSNILVYLSPQYNLDQTVSDMVGIFSAIPSINFNVFKAGEISAPLSQNVHLYDYGDQKFMDILEKCSGIISTAGHTLLSEAMYLGKPVYSIPLPLYEQQKNALIIEQNKFGIKRDGVTPEDVGYFIDNLLNFRNNIKKDTTVLVRGDGKTPIIEYIRKNLLKP